MHIRYTRLLWIRHAIAFGVMLCLLPSLLFARDDSDPYYDYRDEVGRGEFSYDDSQDTPWIENETEVLALPDPDDLTEVKLDQLPPGMSLWVDKSRITVNPEDRVVRAWLWIRSSAGAENGSFEGFRCDTFDYKVYAYGNLGRTPPVTKARKPRWLRASSAGNNNYRRELMSDYFCGYRQSRSPREIADYLTGEYQPDPIFEYH
jgi:hypothetical protein